MKELFTVTLGYDFDKATSTELPGYEKPEDLEKDLFIYAKKLVQHIETGNTQIQPVECLFKEALPEIENPERFLSFVLLVGVTTLTEDILGALDEGGK